MMVTSDVKPCTRDKLPNNLLLKQLKAIVTNNGHIVAWDFSKRLKTF